MVLGGRAEYEESTGREMGTLICGGDAFADDMALARHCGGSGHCMTKTEPKMGRDPL